MPPLPSIGEGGLAPVYAERYTVGEQRRATALMSYADFLACNLDFHVQLASLSGNERLVSALHDLLGSMQRFFFLGLDLDDFAVEMRSEHEELVALMRSGSVADVIDCLRVQINSSRGRILRAVADRGINLPLS